MNRQSSPSATASPEGQRQEQLDSFVSFSNPYLTLILAFALLSLVLQLISVISLLSADVPNTDSPANIDAAKQVREDLAGYKKKVRRLVRQSAEEAFD